MEESTHIFFNALTYIIFIILAGIALLAFFIVFIVKLSQDSKNKWNWLIGVFVSLIALVFAVYLFTQKVVTTVKNIGNVVEEKFEESIDELKKLDSSYKYSFLETNSMVKKLKEFEQMSQLQNVPKEFYVYYGFMDYYRMPLTYPFSIHCTDVLENGSLFSEENVIDFNANDNGETECDLENIKAFAFDNNVLIAKTKINSPEQKESYSVYEFSTNKKSDCKTLKEAFNIARKHYNYRGYDTLITVLNYNKLFN